MRATAVAAIALLALAGTCPAQQQVELGLEWRVEVPKVTGKLSDAEKAEWREQQNKLYLRHFDDKLRLWKFKAAESGKGTFWFSVEQVGGQTPELRAYALVQLPGMTSAKKVWERPLLFHDELNRLTTTRTPRLVLEEITRRLNQQFLGPDFRDNVALLCQHAWVADGVLGPDANGTVGLPLPWDRLKESSQSVFRIYCVKPPGVLVTLDADGLGRSYRDSKGEFLLAQPRQPIAGLKARLVYVSEWRELPPSDPNFDVAGSFP